MPEVLTAPEPKAEKLSLTNTMQYLLVERYAQLPENNGLDENQIGLSWIKKYSAKFRRIIEDPDNYEILDLFERGQEEQALDLVEQKLY